jgi:hypothetical protein
MKITKKYLQKLIKEEVRKLLREVDLPTGSQININQISREIARPEFLDAANLLAAGQGDTRFAERVKVALTRHSGGHAAAMSDLNGVLSNLIDSGVLKGDPGNGVSPELQAQAILSVLSPGDTSTHGEDPSLAYTSRGRQDFSAVERDKEARGMRESRVRIRRRSNSRIK